MNATWHRLAWVLVWASIAACQRNEQPQPGWLAQMRKASGQSPMKGAGSGAQPHSVTESAPSPENSGTPLTDDAAELSPPTTEVAPAADEATEYEGTPTDDGRHSKTESQPEEHSFQRDSSSRQVVSDSAPDSSAPVAPNALEKEEDRAAPSSPSSATPPDLPEPNPNEPIADASCTIRLVGDVTDVMIPLDGVQFQKSAPAGGAHFVEGLTLESLKALPPPAPIDCGVSTAVWRFAPFDLPALPLPGVKADGKQITPDREPMARLTVETREGYTLTAPNGRDICSNRFYPQPSLAHQLKVNLPTDVTWRGRNDQDIALKTRAILINDGYRVRNAHLILACNTTWEIKLEYVVSYSLLSSHGCRGEAQFAGTATLTLDEKNSILRGRLAAPAADVTGTMIGTPEPIRHDIEGSVVDTANGEPVLEFGLPDKPAPFQATVTCADGSKDQVEAPHPLAPILQSWLANDGGAGGSKVNLPAHSFVGVVPVETGLPRGSSALLTRSVRDANRP